MRLPNLFLAVLFSLTFSTFTVSAGSSQDVSLMGRWAEGPCLALEAVDGIAYLGNGAFLEIVDYNPPNGRVLRSRVLLPGPVRGVSVAGGLACVANGTDGLRVIDVSDPDLAFEVGVFPGAGRIEEVVCNDTHAYLAAGEAGLLVVDLSDPAAPFEAGSLDTPGYADDIVVSGGLAFLSDGNILRIIDVSSATDPVELGFLPTTSPYENIFGLDVAGTLAFMVTQRTYGGACGLRVVDVSVPTAPVEIGFLDTFNDAFDVAASGAYALVTAGTAGLRVIDVEDPTAPVEVGFVNPAEWLNGIEVSDHQAYVAAEWDGMTVFDVTIPTAPQRIDRFATRGRATTVAADGDFAYLNLWGDRLHLFDVSDPATPAIGGVFLPTTPAIYLLLEGSYAYVGAGYPDLRIFDMSVPGAPVQISELQIMGTWAAQDIAISGDYAYFPMLGGHSLCGMQIVDISDPAAPFALSYVETSAPRCVAARDGIAYLGDWNGLWIVDATDPENPVVTGTLDTPSKVEDIALKDEHVYMVCAEEGLQIVDVSDPYAPFEEGFYATPGQAAGVYLWGRYAFVADGTAGLRIVDVSEPSTPTEVGFFDTGDWAGSVFVDEGRIYVADGDDGFYILQNDLLSGASDDDLPTVTHLQGVYPNPFNPQVFIDFSLAQPQPVSIAVFDLAGNQVLEIENRMFERGAHSVQWNGGDAAGRAVSSGVYVVQVNTAGLSESQKVTLLR